MRACLGHDQILHGGRTTSREAGCLEQGAINRKRASRLGTSEDQDSRSQSQTAERSFYQSSIKWYLLHRYRCYIRQNINNCNTAGREINIAVLDLFPVKRKPPLGVSLDLPQLSRASLSSISSFWIIRRVRVSPQIYPGPDNPAKRQMGTAPKRRLRGGNCLNGPAPV